MITFRAALWLRNPPFLVCKQPNKKRTLKSWLSQDVYWSPWEWSAWLWKSMEMARAGINWSPPHKHHEWSVKCSARQVWKNTLGMISGANHVRNPPEIEFWSSAIMTCYIHGSNLSQKIAWWKGPKKDHCHLGQVGNTRARYSGLGRKTGSNLL